MNPEILLELSRSLHSARPALLKMEPATTAPTSCLTGVSSFHLDTEFVDQVLEVGCATTDNFYTIEPIVIRGRSRHVLCPRTQKMGSSYVDALSGKQHVGFSNYMLSYSWAYQVGDVVASLAQHCEKENQDPQSAFTEVGEREALVPPLIPPDNEWL